MIEDLLDWACGLAAYFRPPPDPMVKRNEWRRKLFLEGE